MRYKIEAEGDDGHWIELIRGDGTLDEARAKAAELASRAHNRDVAGWRITEFADADFRDRVAVHETG
jgi:hypothetical protein